MKELLVLETKRCTDISTTGVLGTDDVLKIPTGPTCGNFSKYITRKSWVVYKQVCLRQSAGMQKGPEGPFCIYSAETTYGRPIKFEERTQPPRAVARGHFAFTTGPEQMYSSRGDGGLAHISPRVPTRSGHITWMFQHIPTVVTVVTI